MGVDAGDVFGKGLGSRISKVFAQERASHTQEMLAEVSRVTDKFILRRTNRLWAAFGSSNALIANLDQSSREHITYIDR